MWIVRGDFSHALENWNLPKKRDFDLCLNGHYMQHVPNKELRGCETIERRLSFDISTMLLTCCAYAYSFASLFDFYYC
jgi:hypothetical protein